MLAHNGQTGIGNAKRARVLNMTQCRGNKDGAKSDVYDCLVCPMNPFHHRNVNRPFTVV